MHTIPILGADGESELASLAGGALPAGARITTRQAGDGVHLDAATLALVVDASKDVLVAALTMLGSVWAATIAARASAAGRSSSPEPAAGPPAIEVDTLADSHVLLVDERLEQQLRAVIPDRVQNVLNIRLRVTGRG
jgi:hypothetical protein